MLSDFGWVGGNVKNKRVAVSGYLRRNAFPGG
jgi:hypothetical protein